MKITMTKSSPMTANRRTTYENFRIFAERKQFVFRQKFLYKILDKQKAFGI